MDHSPDAVPPLIPPEPVPGPGDQSVPPRTSVGPWGVWITLGWTLTIGAGYLLAQAIVLVVYLGPRMFPHSRTAPSLDEIAKDGLLLSLATLFSTLVGVGLCVLFAWLRKGIRVRDYLGLRWAGGRATLRWCIAVIAFWVASDVMTTLVLDRPLVPEVMVEIYRNAGIRLLLWLAIVVAGPVVEEFMFRGFLLPGLRGPDGSGWRDLIAVAVSSGAWAALHLQYDAYGVTTIFLGGLLLGYARIRTGSLMPCLLMHMIMNFVSTVEVELVMA